MRQLLIGVILVLHGLAGSSNHVLAQDSRIAARVNSHTHFMVMPARNIEEWSTRRTQLKRQILASAGLYPFPNRPELKSYRFDATDHGHYRVEKVIIETMPGYFLAGNLYSPNPGRSTKAAAILVPHGHWKHGRIHNTETYSVPALCINLASQGYVAFAYDMVGYNDTVQTSHDFGESPAEQLWSFNPLGLQLWNSIRSLDFLQSLDMVDPLRIGMTGASGGATQTLLLSAVDERVRVVAPVNMVSAHFQGDDACELAPGLRVGTNNVEIASMIAPRPMILVSASGDWTKNTPNVEFPSIMAFYRLFGGSNYLSTVRVEAPHNYNRDSREAVYAFFNQFLQVAPGPAGQRETEAVDFDPRTLLLGQAMLTHTKGSTQESVFRAWREMTHLSLNDYRQPELEDALRTVTGVEWPAEVSPVTVGGKLFLERRGSGDLVPVAWVPGTNGHVTVLVHPDGVDASRRSPQFVHELAQGNSLLLLEPFRVTVQPGSKNTRGKDFLTYQRADDARRVQDIVAGLAFAGSMENGRKRLVCSGRARAWCLLSAALSPLSFELDDDVQDVGASDEDLRKNLFIPGLQRAGGLAAARALLKDKRQAVSLKNESLN